MGQVRASRRQGSHPTRHYVVRNAGEIIAPCTQQDSWLEKDASANTDVADCLNSMFEDQPLWWQRPQESDLGSNLVFTEFGFAASCPLNWSNDSNDQDLTCIETTFCLVGVSRTKVCRERQPFCFDCCRWINLQRSKVMRRQTELQGLLPISKPSFTMFYNNWEHNFAKSQEHRLGQQQIVSQELKVTLGPWIVINPLFFGLIIPHWKHLGRAKARLVTRPPFLTSCGNEARVSSKQIFAMERLKEESEASSEVLCRGFLGDSYWWSKS